MKLGKDQDLGGVPFVDSYGDEGFFETGLPNKLIGSTIGSSVPNNASVPVVASVPLEQSGIG